MERMRRLMSIILRRWFSIGDLFTMPGESRCKGKGLMLALLTAATGSRTPILLSLPTDKDFLIRVFLRILLTHLRIQLSENRTEAMLNGTAVMGTVQKLHLTYLRSTSSVLPQQHMMMMSMLMSHRQFIISVSQ